jgi:Polyketide cyclase / dehydrase and lipid transport
MFDAFELERPGHAEPMGVGAIRVFVTRVSKAREEIVELIPDRRLSYVLLSGFPLRNYRADVDLTPDASGGTSISWRASFDPIYRGTGWFWRLFLARVLKKSAADLAAGAENPRVVAQLQGAAM